MTPMPRGEPLRQTLPIRETLIPAKQVKSHSLDNDPGELARNRKRR
jgi:hypothetical protein